MNNKDQILTIAKRMKKLCNKDHKPSEAMAFFRDAITLMDLVLNEGGEV